MSQHIVGQFQTAFPRNPLHCTTTKRKYTQLLKNQPKCKAVRTARVSANYSAQLSYTNDIHVTQVQQV